MKLWQQEADGEKLEFACRIFERLDVFAPATLDAWYLLHKEKQPQYYHALVASLPQR